MIAVCICGMGLLSDPVGTSIVANEEIPQLRVDREFEAELDRNISATWRGIPLRQLLRQLSRARGIAVLLDRRIDPAQELTLEIEELPLEVCCTQIAAQVSAGVGIVDNTVFVGPADSAGKLRTLVQLRTNELFDDAHGISKRRQFELVQRYTQTWNDFERPSDLLRRVAENYGLRIEGGERIPHDLWSGGTLPQADACTAVSSVLIQFDLTFEWIDEANAIRIVPVPPEVAIETTVQPRGLSAEEAVSRLQTEIPDLAVEIRGRKLLLRGTAEQVDAAQELVRPRSKQPRRGRTFPAPLHRRQLTFRRQRVRFSSLLKSLEQNGIVFQYDGEVLRTAGIDLDQVIDIEARRTPADELLELACDPLGLTFQIDGATVTLIPK